MKTHRMRTSKNVVLTAIAGVCCAACCAWAQEASGELDTYTDDLDNVYSGYQILQEELSRAQGMYTGLQNSYAEQKQQFERQLGELSMKIERLQQEIVSVNAQKNMCAQTVEMLTADKSALEQKYEEASSRLHELRAHLAQAQTSAAQLRREREGAVLEKEKLIEQFQTLRNERDSLESQVRTTQSSRAQIEESLRQHSQSAQELEVDRQRILSLSRDCEQRVAELTGQKSRLEEQLSLLAQEKAQMQSLYDQALETVEKHTSDNRLLRGEINEQQALIGQLSMEKETVAQERRTWEIRSSKSQNDVQLMTEQLNKELSRLQSLQQENDRLLGVIDGLNLEKEQSLIRIDQLKAQVQEKSGSMEATRELIAKRQARIAELENALHESESLRKQAQEISSGREAAHSALQKEIGTCQKNIGDYERNLALLKEQLEARQGELRDALSRISSYEAQITGYTAQLDDRDDTITTLKASVQTKEQEMQALLQEQMVLRGASQEGQQRYDGLLKAHEELNKQLASYKMMIDERDAVLAEMRGKNERAAVQNENLVAQLEEGRQALQNAEGLARENQEAVRQLTAQIEARDAQIEELRVSEKQAQDALIACMDEKHALSEEQQRYEHSSREGIKELEELKNRVMLQEEEITQCRQHLSERADEREKLLSNEQEAQLALGERQSELDRLRASLAEREETLAGMKKVVEEKEAHLARQQEERQSLLDTISGYKERAAQLDQDRQQSDRLSKEFIAQHAALEKEKKMLSDQLKRQQEDAQKLQQAIDSLRAEQAGAQSKNTKTREDLGNFERENKRLNSLLSEKQKQLDALRRRSTSVRALREQLRVKERALAQAQKHQGQSSSATNKLETLVKGYETELARLKQEKTLWQSNLAQKEQALEALRRDREAVTKERAVLSTKQGSLASTVDQMRSENERLKAEVKHLQGATQIHKQTSAYSKETLDMLQNEIRTKEERIAQLVKELARLKDKAADSEVPCASCAQQVRPAVEQTPAVAKQTPAVAKQTPAVAKQAPAVAEQASAVAEQSPAAVKQPAAPAAVVEKTLPANEQPAPESLEKQLFLTGGRASAVNHTLAQIYIEQQQYAEAAEEYEKALLVDEQDAVAHFNLGLIEGKHFSKKEQALYHFKRYLQLVPEGEAAQRARDYSLEFSKAGCVR